jgi:S-ribosylhomocysteine lyase LuxS involved in autoinducer biosynthesis
MSPYENRTECIACKTKGYLKIVKTDKSKKVIESFLNRPKNIMYSFKLESEMVMCYCQNCGNVSNYNVQEGLFSDGVIKEI